MKISLIRKWISIAVIAKYNQSVIATCQLILSNRAASVSTGLFSWIICLVPSCDFIGVVWKGWDCRAGEFIATRRDKPDISVVFIAAYRMLGTGQI
jgi:hypothetical protein